jgi:hypothetical protein
MEDFDAIRSEEREECDGLELLQYSDQWADRWTCVDTMDAAYDALEEVAMNLTDLL